MKISVVVARPWEVAADVLAVPVGPVADPATFDALDRRLEGAIAAYRALGLVRDEGYATALIRATGIAADWVLALGVGPVAGFDQLAAYRLGAVAERRLSGLSVRHLAVVLPDGVGEDLSQTALATLVARGVVEGTYDPATIYRGEVRGSPPALEALTLVAAKGDAAALRSAAERGLILGDGANRARTLSQRASNDVSPEVLADEAVSVAREAGLTVEVLGPEQAEALGMGMFMAVGRGSDNPPRFIVMRAGAPDARDARGRLLAMVGKGVTFDSGGLSIKPSDRMEEMKMDKTGACTVIHAIATAHALAPELPLLALAPAVENMPGPHSTRPGDVVRALNGKWVEVNNTDAEGRLILGDAMTYAERLGATHLVDVATLTGAVSRAYGDMITGGFGTPRAWWEELEEAAAEQGERFWQIPFVDEYHHDMESWYAEIRNSFGGEGSLVKSGMFLREFRTVPWIHLDIGGSGWLNRQRPWAARGATGVTHATLVELALRGARSDGAASSGRTTARPRATRSQASHSSRR
jgi:leucyl aminopeptidase